MIRQNIDFKSIVVAGAVSLVLVIGTGVWLLVSVDDSESADSLVKPAENGAMVGLAHADDTRSPLPTRSVFVEANAAPSEPAAVKIRSIDSGTSTTMNGLKISAQSWSRGGLGSKALVTFTLRNENAYPVKDVAIACAFSRQDGSHLTDRTRVIPGEIAKKSRKKFAAFHVGFVNVNASKVTCAVASAEK